MQRRDARDGHVECEREAARGRQSHPHAREAARPGTDDERVERAGLESGLLHQFVGRRKHFACLPQALAEQLAGAQERAGRPRGGGVKGEDRAHCRS